MLRNELCREQGSFGWIIKTEGKSVRHGIMWTRIQELLGDDGDNSGDFNGTVG